MLENLNSQKPKVNDSGHQTTEEHAELFATITLFNAKRELGRDISREENLLY